MTAPDAPLLPPLTPGSPREQQLREMLDAISRNAPPGIRGQIDAVLRGELSLREFALTDGFSALTQPAVARVSRAFGDMTEEQRRAFEAEDGDTLGDLLAW